MPPIKILFSIVFVSALAFLSEGCASTADTTDVSTSTGTVAVPTTVLNTAYTAANVLQQFNTGLQASLPTVTQVLTATHNSGDVGIANDVAVGSSLITALVSAVANTVKAAQAAGASTTQTQAAVNATLAPANVATIAANVVTTSASQPATSP